MGFLITLCLAGASGFVGSLAFPHFTLWPALFFSTAGLLLSLRRAAKGRRAFGQILSVSVFWGIAFFAPQLSWAVVPAGSLAPWIALVLMETLFIIGFAFLWLGGEDFFQGFKRFYWLLSLVWAPLAWITLEQLRSLIPWRGFPWSKLAFALVDSPLVAWAPWGGSAAVSGATIFVSVAFVNVFTLGLGRIRRFLTALLAVAVVAAPLLVTPPALHRVGSIRIAAVQGNTPGREPQTAFGEAYQVLQNHVDESLRLAKTMGANPVDLVLWPENAADVDPREDLQAAEMVNSVVKEFSAPLLTGTLGRGSDSRNSTGPGRYFNTIIYWDAGKALDTYSKQHLVPFGEYLPSRDFFEKLFPPVKQLIPQDLSPGSSVAQLRVQAGGHRLTLATPICFEIADDDLVRQAATGAAFIYIPTSNTFFGSSDEADQQLAIARFRAIEHGLDAVQVSTMDSTARIDHQGRILGPVIGNFVKGSFITTMPVREGNTPATLYGGLLASATMALGAAFALLLVLLRVKESWNREK